MPLLFLLAGWCASARAASDFETARLKAVAANPPGVSVTLSLPEGITRFHRGEIIPLSAVFTSSLPKTYRILSGSGSRTGAWSREVFQVDASRGVSDPLAVYETDRAQSYTGPGPRSEPLEAQPVTVGYTLNEWLRFDAPGHYRVYLSSDRVTDLRKGRDDFFSFPGRTTTSNAVDLDILPEDPAWEAHTLQEALPLYIVATDDVKGLEAARTLRFLGTADAAKALVAAYGKFSEFDFANSPLYFQTRLGLLASPQRAFVIDEMKRRIADPDFPVTQNFLSDLAQIRSLAAYTQPVLAYIAGNLANNDERQEAFYQRDQALMTFEKQGDTELADAVSAKRGTAGSVSLFTLLVSDYYASQDAVARRQTVQALVSRFGQLPPGEQRYLLEDEYWPLLRGAALGPLLRALYEHPPAEKNYNPVDLRSLALRRLMEISPAEGRVLLLAEIASAQPRVDLPTLCSLPDRTLPALDNVLAAHLKNGDWEIESRLVQRYATKSVLARVKAVYGNQGGELACALQSNLLAYFLRTDAKYGAAQMRLALAARKDTGCYRTLLSDVAALAPGPEAEHLAVAHLHDADLWVQADAAKALGAHGSPAAEAPLWARLREWHQQRAGKPDPGKKADSASSRAGEQFEYTLTQALTTAPSWLLPPAKLHALQALCVNSGAQRNTADALRQWQNPIRITYRGIHDEWSVAQYEETSVTALQSKLAQFPRGTRFLLSSTNLRGEARQTQVFKQLRPLLTARGMKIDREPPFKRPQKAGN